MEYSNPNEETVSKNIETLSSSLPISFQVPKGKKNFICLDLGPTRLSMGSNIFINIKGNIISDIFPSHIPVHVCTNPPCTYEFQVIGEMVIPNIDPITNIDNSPIERIFIEPKTTVSVGYDIMASFEGQNIEVDVSCELKGLDFLAIQRIYLISNDLPSRSGGTNPPGGTTGPRNPPKG